MKISIIIPCYNNADLLGETLACVQHQSISDWDCLVVDDGSADDSVSIVNSFAASDKRFKGLARPSNLPKGANSCRNYGASKCSGTHLIFLDADDLLSHDCLEVRVNSCKDEDLLIFSTAHFTNSIEDTTPFISGLNLHLDAMKYRDMFLGYWIPWHLSSGLWKRTFFEKTGGFDLDLKRFQDVEFHARALSFADLKFRMDYSHGYTSYYRKSSFHTKIGLEKRRFILDQGFAYANKLKSQFKPHDFQKSAGLFVYLLFRFEEVINSRDLAEVKRLFTDSQAKRGSQDLRGDLALLVNLYEKTLIKPYRFRKYLAYAIFRKFRFTQVRRLNS